jgi:hypothetical protein
MKFGVNYPDLPLIIEKMFHHSIPSPPPDSLLLRPHLLLMPPSPSQLPNPSHHGFPNGGWKRGDRATNV